MCVNIPEINFLLKSERLGSTIAYIILAYGVLELLHYSTESYTRKTPTNIKSALPPQKNYCNVGIK